MVFRIERRTKRKNGQKFFFVFCFVLFLLSIGSEGLRFGFSLLSGPEEVLANPDIEILRPTSYTESGYETTNPTYAYDTSTSTYSDTNAGNSDSYPTMTFHTWASKTQTYTGLVLKVSRSSTGYKDDQWGIKYSPDGGSNWYDLDAMSSNNVSQSTVSVDLYAQHSLLDPANLQVRIDGEKVHGGDRAHVYVYDIWTEGEYTTATLSVSISDGAVDYGIVAPGGSKSTLAGDLNDMQTATNDGNTTENFNIKGQNTACPWTLASSAGNDQYVHQFCNDTDNDCSSPPTNYTALTTSYQTLATGVSSSGSVDFQLRITTPTSSSCFDQQSVDVTVQAVQG